MVLTSPNKLENYNNISPSFFLAGTIENGNSTPWQFEIADYAKEIGATVFNPRREKWDPNASSAEIENQINWELEHMERADYIIMNILPDSKSPISLLEFGLYAKEGKLFVFCPKNFYRFDNVRVTCERYGVKLYSIDNYSNNMDEIKLLMLEKIRFFEKCLQRKK